MAAAVEIPVGVNYRARATRERGEAVELKVALEDDPVGDFGLYCRSDIPQGRRPDLPVIVFVGVLAVIERFVGQFFIHPADTGRIVRCVFDPVPGPHRCSIVLSLLVGEETCRKIITKTFTHRRRLSRLAKARTDSILNCVPQFVKNDLSILGIVDAAKSERQTTVMRAEP